MHFTDQHGDSVRAMLEIYAASLDGRTESDLKAIEQPMKVPLVPQFPVPAGQVAERVARPFAISHPHPVPRSCHWRDVPSATA
jgi:hypothetical protein